tara:strand:- start:2340 stop:2798 length:459 start_codon:yes stop_codon:yes gene_type:complete
MKKDKSKTTLKSFLGTDMLSRLTTFCVLLSIHSYALADRYGIQEYFYDEEDRNSKTFFIHYIIVFIVSGIAWLWMKWSIDERSERKKQGIKPKKLEISSDWIIRAIGYGVISFFLAFPIVLILKWVSPSFSLDLLWWTWGSLFLWVWIIRRT